MPVIGIPVDMLKERVATELTSDQMVTKLQQLGCDVEGYATLRRFRCSGCTCLMEITETENPPVVCEACGQDFRSHPERLQERGSVDVVRMELLAVRPDMFDPAGLARTLRGYLGEHTGPVRYELGAPRYRVEVETGLIDPDSPDYRPICCAVLRGVDLDEDRIKVIMKLQENLHWAMGRDRKRASIGVYDLDSFDVSSGVTYRLTEPSTVSFVPLGKSEEMTCAQVLTDHPKGPPYAHLLKDKALYPLLSGKAHDGGDQIMAFIPIINSEETKVTSRTKNLFMDVTGLEQRLINKILNTLVTALLELCPGSTAEQVEIVKDGIGEALVTPDLSSQGVQLDPELPLRRIGLKDSDLFPEHQGKVSAEMRRTKIIELLERMGHGVDVDGEGMLSVQVPAYRNDILHQVDLVEDIAIAFGYHNLKPTLVPSFTVGVETPQSVLTNRAREALTGQNFLEVLTLILSSEEIQYDRLGRVRRNDTVRLAHPISQEQTMVRTSLLPGLLETFAVNTDHPLPQKIFEVGRVSLLDEHSEVGAREHLRVAAALLGTRVDLSTIKGVAETLLSDLGFRSAQEVRPLEKDDPRVGSFLPSRVGAIWVEGREVLVFGELHPQVLENFGLGYPVALLEADLEPLLQSPNPG